VPHSEGRESNVAPGRAHAKSKLGKLLHWFDLTSVIGVSMGPLTFETVLLPVCMYMGSLWAPALSGESKDGGRTRRSSRPQSRNHDPSRPQESVGTCT
jgi:hypothetical protein